MNPFCLMELSEEGASHLVETSHDCFFFATQSIEHRSAASAALGSLLEMLNLGLNQNLYLARSWGDLYMHQSLRSPRLKVNNN